jgi:hypothetical protein
MGLDRTLAAPPPVATTEGYRCNLAAGCHRTPPSVAGPYRPAAARAGEED